MVDQTKPPHPESNPLYSKVDYVCNAIFAIAKIELALFIKEGANLHEAAKLAQTMQESIGHAYHLAVQVATQDVVGPPPPPPSQDLSDDNPFNNGA